MTVLGDSILYGEKRNYKSMMRGFIIYYGLVEVGIGNCDLEDVLYGVDNFLCFIG